MKNKIYTILALAIISAMFSGCEGFLEELPYGSVTPESFYQTEEDAEMAATSCYSQLNNPTNFWAAGLDGIGMISTDDVTQFLGWPLVLPVFDFDATHEVVTGAWNSAYTGISRCNTCIDNVSLMEDIDETIKNESLAQAYCLRAYWYFRLVRLYGAVPLVVKEYSSLDDLYLPRSPVADVYDLIISDLEFAAEHLPTSWSEQGRVTKGAAMSYLTLVHMQLKDYATAEAWATKVMELESQGIYGLESDFETIINEYNENNKESIHELQYSSEFYVTWRAIYLSPRSINLARSAGYGWIQCSNSIVNEFEDGDLRFECTFFTPGEILNINGEDFEYTAEMGTLYGENEYCIKKGNVYYGDSRNGGLNTVLMRYAEIILLRAEALNEQGKTTEAIPYLKRIRDRAGLTTNASYTQDEMREAIIHERRVEFAFEEVRGWDIIRWGIQAETLGQLPNSRWTAGKNELYPIPTFVFDENLLVTENNPGW